MNCVNINDVSFQELLEASKLPSLLLEMRIAKWQEQNGFESFPKVEDIIQSNETLNKVDFTSIIDDNQESIFETQYKKAENAGDNSFNRNKNLLFGEKEVTDTLHVNEILDNMIKSQDLEMSPEFVFILGKAMSINKLSNAKFKLVTKESFDELASKSAGKGTPVMYYDEATNTISTTVEVLEQISMTDLALSILHEVAHSTTSHYYNNPNISLQAKELKDLIDAAFQQYKYLADKKNPNGEYSYGFTNEKEFIAELYANPQFRQEIIDLDKGFWRKLIDAIRRTFNLPKTKYNDQLIESALLISTVEQFVENNESSQLVGSAKNNYSSSFNSVDFKKLDDIKNETFEDKLNNLYSVAQDNIDQLLRRAEASAKKHGTKNEKFVDKINLLKEHLTNAELLNKWEGVNSYVDFMIGQIMYIDKKINNGTLDEQLDIIDKLYEYAAASDLIKPLRELFKDERIKTLPQETQDFIKQVNVKLRQFSGIHDDNVTALFSKRKEIAKKLLQNPYYSQEVISQFEKELSKEYPQNSKISKKEWVSQQLLGPRAKELEDRINKHINELFEGIGTDISKWDKTIYSTLNTSSRLIQLVQKIISSMKLKIDNEVNDFDFQLTDVYNRFVKKHNITKPSEMFKNILEYDSEGNAYVKGFFNLKFKDKYRTEYIPLLNERNKLIEKYTEEGITLKEMYNFKDYTEISEKINIWRKTNMTKVRVKNEDGTSSVKWQPKVDLYKNDFSKLSQEEKEFLVLYRNIAKDSDKIHRGKKSLLRNAGTALYFKLPSVSISNMERIIEGKLNVKDTLSQKFSELTSWRPEEIEQYEKQFNALGEEINSIPVLFRNKIKPEEQSLDIFTLIRLEKYNQINYKNKESNQLILETLNDVAKNKQYLKTEAGTGNAVKNLFGIKSKHVTFEGVKSQTHARVKNVIEQALYNKFNEEGFKILGKDVNKIVQTVNGHVGFLGMTLNYFNAPVNVLNGEFQIMLEKIGGNISKNKLMKAHTKYSADLPNIIADISRPNKLSLVNQLNLKFDIFGGLSHNQQEFIKNNFAKAVANKETLQVLQNGGEHLIQSVLNMALLDSIKVRNKEGLYIDKDGKVVTEDKAASILDMVSLNEETKKLEFSKHLEYTDKSTVVKWNNGGLENVRLFIKKKIFDTMGEYDKNFQVNLQRHWYGQLVLMYKKFFIPLSLARYRGGIDKIFKNKENLDPSQMHWNEALQEYEEGFYITFGRYLMSVINNALTTMIPNLKWQMTSQKWSEMSDYEKGNIKKGIFEFGMIVMLHMVIIPLLLGFADDDDELLYLAFLGRRLGQELSQYSDIGDAYKITRNPIASLNLIEDTIAVGKFVLSPGAWFSTTKEGDSRFLNAAEKVLIPSAWREDKSSESMIKYMNRELIVPFEDGYLYKSIFGTEEN